MGAVTNVFIISLNENNIQWRNKMFKSEALIVTKKNGREEIVEIGTGQ